MGAKYEGFLLPVRCCTASSSEMNRAPVLSNYRQISLGKACLQLSGTARGHNPYGSSRDLRPEECCLPTLCL